MSKLGIVGKTILEHYPNGFFSLDQIAKATKFPRKLVSDTLFIFSQEGLIKKIRKQRKEHIPGHSPRFSLTYTANRKALAARIAPRLKEGTVQDAMWKTIRGKRQFNLRDLIILAGVKRAMARWYLKGLRGLEIIRPSRTGGGLGVEWRLVNDVGLKRPYIKTNRKAKNEGMKDKGETSVRRAKMDGRLHVCLSKEEHESVKKQASRYNLSISAYLRKLLRDHRGAQKTPYASL
jgi:hypothetical protein